ncbi:hypothetical protein GC173_00865 [bacterium]|nr:hypothetical protein [bacterium]
MKTIASLFLSGALAAIVAHAPAAESTFVPKIPIMEVGDLRPGMTGYGLSVFEGSTPRKFNIVIKGVLTNRFAGSDMIIIESDDPIMKDIGGVAGMSGSPIFVDEKLVGAFAYGWGFSVRPVNGVTPIREMMKVMDLITTESKVSPDELPTSLAGWESARRELARTFPPLPTRDYARTELESIGLEPPDAGADTVTFQPLGTPLLSSSQSPLVMGQLEKMFAGTSLRPVMAGMQGGAMGDARGRDLPDLKVVNGGALSVIIAEGDLALAGLGTTTYVQDDRLVAFGHPMMGSGAVDIPIAVSEVLTVIPTVARPFKVGNALKTVGALRQDRLPAVGGSLSAAPPVLMPLSVHITAPESKLDQTFNYRLWNDRSMMPQISMVCVLESLDKVRMGGPMGMDMSYTITLKNGRTISATEYMSGDMFLSMMAAMGMAETLDIMANNPFKAPGVESVAVDIRFGDRDKMMVFDRVTKRLPNKIEPGDSVQLDLRYQRWRKDHVDLPVKVQLPKSLRAGSYTLRVMDGRERLQLEYTNRPELRRIDSYDQLVEALQPNFPGNQAYVVLLSNEGRQTMDGKVLSSVPTSIAMATQATSRRPDAQGTAPGAIVWESKIPVDGMLLGGTTVTLQVEEPTRP